MKSSTWLSRRLLSALPLQRKLARSGSTTSRRSQSEGATTSRTPTAISLLPSRGSRQRTRPTRNDRVNAQHASSRRGHEKRYNAMRNKQDGFREAEIYSGDCGADSALSALIFDHENDPRLSLFED